MHVGWGRPTREGIGSVERWRSVAGGVRKQSDQVGGKGSQVVSGFGWGSLS